MAQKSNTKGTTTLKQPRKLKASGYRSFRLERRAKHTPANSLPSAFVLLGRALKLLAAHWKVFTGISLVYGFLTLVFVQGIAGGSIAETKNSLMELSNGQLDGLLTSVVLFVYMAGASGNTTSSTGGIYQIILTLITSLALIWTLRQAYANKRVHIREGFYKGMYPLIPFVLVFLVVLLQLIPLLIGAFLYNLVGQGITTTAAEILLWNIAFFMLATLSLYMVASSIFALYIVCLPDVTPMAALRSARELVRNRRWIVIRKIIFLPIILLVAAALVMVPIIFWAAPIASLAFLAASMFGLAVVHSYMYQLYRELL